MAEIPDVVPYAPVATTVVEPTRFESRAFGLRRGRRMIRGDVMTFMGALGAREGEAGLERAMAPAGGAAVTEVLDDDTYLIASGDAVRALLGEPHRRGPHMDLCPADDRCLRFDVDDGRSAASAVVLPDVEDGPDPRP